MNRSKRRPGSEPDIQFGFIVHPPSLADVRRVVPATRLLPDGLVLSLLRRRRPYVLSRIRHVRSRLGHEITGCFVGCPLVPRQMLDLDERLVTGRITAAARIAERLGAGIVGLGGYTSVVGEKGLFVSRSAGIAVTSGNALTAWSAVESVRRLAAREGLKPGESCLAVIGATGSIGSMCARKLTGEVGSTIITARRREQLDALRVELEQAGASAVRVETDVHQAIARANLIITTTSAPDALFDVADLSPGSIVIDLSVPKNVSARAHPRSDVTVVDGGRIRLPGQVEFSLDLGLPKGIVYACMAETMALALEGRFESFSIGDRIDPERVDEIGVIAERHGFSLELPAA